MKKIFLLRAYGDFIIAIGLINKSPKNKDIQIFASSHFESLFKSISKYLNFENLNINFINLSINNSLLNFFTNRYFLKKETILQLISLKKFLTTIHKENYYLEHKSRSNLLNFILNERFQYILNGKEVYKEWFDFLDYNANEFLFSKLKANDKILILPDARVFNRKIPERIILEIESFAHKNNLKCSVSSFLKVKKSNNDYSNFEELINLINAADFIITADSLTTHLSFMLQKQHFIFYPSNGKKNFFTPFVLKNNCFCSFNENIDKYFNRWI